MWETVDMNVPELPNVPQALVLYMAHLLGDGTGINFLLGQFNEVYKNIDNLTEPTFT